MKKMKRFAALLIAFATIATSSVFSLSVFAEEAIAEEVLTEEVVEIPAGYQVTDKDKIMVEKLEAFGAIENANADITAKVTRREMANIIATYMRVPNTGAEHATSPFVDVDITDKDLETVVSLFNAGIITGDESFRFYPDANMTYDEALVFVVNAIGYKTFAARNGGFPTGYHRVAIQLGMLKDLLMQSGKDEIILRDVYKLMEVGLGAAAIEFDFYIGRDAEYKVSKTDDFLSVTYGITTHKGIVTGSEDTFLASASSNLTDEQIEIDYKIYDTPGYVYATSIGRSVTYYLRKDSEGHEEIAYVEENDADNTITKVLSDDLLPEKTTDTRIYFTDDQDKERHIKFANATDVIYNGRAYKGYGSLKNVLPAYGYIEALDNTGDNVADVLFVYAYKNIVVEAVDAYEREIISKETKEAIPMDLSSKDAKVFSGSISVRDLNQIQKGDVLTIMESKSTPKLTTAYISTREVAGQITEVSEELGLCVNDTYYRVAGDYFGLDLTIGMDVCLYLDINGRIVYGAYNTTGTGTAAYAVMTGFDYNGSSVNSELQIRLYTSEGKFLTLPAAPYIMIDNVRYSTKGEDVNKVMELLSKGFTNDKGKYAVNSAYIVGYKQSNEKLTYIDTGKTGQKGNLSLLAERSSELLPRFPAAIMRITASGTTQFANVVNGKVIVFSTPSDGKLHETDKYGITNTLTEHHYAPLSGQYYKTVENSDVYTLGTSEVKRADVILLRGASVASAVSDTGSLYRVVTKFTNAVDEDGMPSKKMYIGDVGYVLAQKVIYKINGASKEVLSTSKEISDIQPGTVIQYGVDETGKVNGISIVASYDAETGTVTPHHIATGSFGTDNANRVSGTIVACDTETGAVEIKRADKDESVIVKMDAKSSVTIYHSSTQKTSSGTVSSLMVGDFAVVRVGGYYTVGEIVTVR